MYMRKLTAVLIISFVTAFFFASNVFAETFALTKIGSIDLNGKTYTHFWFEPTNLTLEGTGSRGANIDVTIDGVMQTIKASTENGTWKYTHSSLLEKKDHSVTIGSGDQSISFTLTIGATEVPADAQTSSASGGISTLPTTGNLLPTLGILGVVGTLLYFGFRERKA